ncbi:MAG: oxidoreductase FAD/NAD(P)-binding domain protein [Ferruginibacter sp.]|nr:oxidoreductase FAD/NAD(P)-binding domain protein [Ferruginibacter sp.]
MKNIVRILDIQAVTHDVKCFRMEKPAGYQFVPGQATDVSINQPGWEAEKRPFTFTALNTAPYLEFTIKGYPDHHGVTEQLHLLRPGDEIIIEDAWGAIEYKRPGYFIAGGAGITPFIAILRTLHHDNRLAGNTLLFSNKTSADIIYESELKTMLGEQAIYLLTKENKPGYQNGYLDENFLREHITQFNQHFYVCGPDKMVQDIAATLEKLGANVDAVIFEK